MSFFSPINKGGRRGATAAAVGSILLWCTSGVCFTSGARLLGPMVYLTLMTATGVITVVLLQSFRRRPLGDLIRLPFRVIIAGFWGVSFYTVILAFAFGTAPEQAIGQVNLLNYLWPVWIVLLSTFLIREKIRPIPMSAGVLLGFSGIVSARGVSDLLRMPEAPLPLVLALLGGFLWALYSVLLRRWRIPEEQGGTAFHFTLCAAMAAAVAAFQGEWQNLPPVGPEALFWVLFGGIGPVGLAYHWWEIGVKRGNVPLISTLAYFTPIGSTLLISLLFREAMGPGLISGSVLIAAGAWLAGRSVSN
ncbi:MAG: EamA family transporter [Deltaproteobacteria bacterium]|nr:EamA family transporter [Deltaproteobacteria bacterium]